MANNTQDRTKLFQHDEKYPLQDSDDSFSTYNAKKLDVDHFANYNAKKTKLATDVPDRPNLTVSVPFDKEGSGKFAKKNRRVSRSTSEERDLRCHLDAKRHLRDSKYRQSPGKERVHGKKYDDERIHDKRQPDERRNDQRRQNDKRRDEKIDEICYNDKRYPEGRCYDDRRSNDDQSYHDDKRTRDNRDQIKRHEESKVSKNTSADHNRFRQVPAFILQEKEMQAPLAHPIDHRINPERELPPYRKDNPSIRDTHDYNYLRARPPPLEQYSRQERHPQNSRIIQPDRRHALVHERQQLRPSRDEYYHPVHSDQIQPLAYHDRRYDKLRQPVHPHDQRPPLYLGDQRHLWPENEDVHGHQSHRNELKRPCHIDEERVQSRHPDEIYLRPPPPENYSHRDRFGPLNTDLPGTRQTPPRLMQKADLSDVAEIMKKLKENASKDLKSTKEMITNLLPPKPTQSAPTVVETISSNSIEKESTQLGGTDNTSSVTSHNANIISSSTPEKHNKFFDMFSKTADAYKSNWVKTPEKEESTPSTSLQDDDKDRVIKLSGNLEVNLDEVNESQVNLIAKYLKHRTRGLRAVADFVPLRVKKTSENDENESALDTVKSVRNAFNTIPKTIPGTISCDLCQKYNLPPDEYRRHVNTDFHCWMDGSWRYKLSGHVPRFALLWCIICKDFFMLTFEGNTMNGHEDSEKHRKNLAIQRLHYNNVPKVKFCLLSELRTTKVKLPTPLKCKYFMPKEALNMYKAAYSKLCERHLVLD